MLSTLVIGTLGTGKSTFLNTCTGKQNFLTSAEPEGCTHNYSMIDLIDKQLQFIDSPGLHDPKMPIGTWIEELKEDGMKNRKINLCLIVLMQKVRPDNLDKSNILITMEALNNL